MAYCSLPEQLLTGCCSNFCTLIHVLPPSGSVLGFCSPHRIDGVSHRTVTDWSPSDIPCSDAEHGLCSRGIQTPPPAQQQLPVSLAQLGLQKWEGRPKETHGVYSVTPSHLTHYLQTDLKKHKEGAQSRQAQYMHKSICGCPPLHQGWLFYLTAPPKSGLIVS